MIVFMSEFMLHRGVRVSALAQSLRPLIVDGNNIAASGGGNDPYGIQNRYLQWAETVEHALRQFFASSWVWEELHGPRWMQINSLNQDTARPYSLIADEARAQTDNLQTILEQLERSQTHFELPSGCVAVVPDTNVFLHHTFFKEIDWLELAQAKEVRLVVPLAVVKELDERSYRSDDRGDRAKKVIRALRKLQAGLDTPEQPAILSTGVKLQLLMEPPGHESSANVDDEILTRAEYLSSLTEGRVHIATGDYGMQAQAVMRGLKCLELPQELRLGSL
jgi:rRNA-processing protein FCF1